jgi:hypothetical protein
MSQKLVIRYGKIKKLDRLLIKGFVARMRKGGWTDKDIYRALRQFPKLRDKSIIHTKGE